MIDILDRISELKELKHLHATGDLREYDFDVRIAQLMAEVTKFERDNAPVEGAQLVLNQDLWDDPNKPAYIKISHTEGSKDA